MSRPSAAASGMLFLVWFALGCGGQKPEPGGQPEAAPGFPAGATVPTDEGQDTPEPAGPPHYYRRVMVVGVGIESYKHLPSKAPCAERDVRELLKLFRERYGYETIALTGPQATRTAIRETLDKVKKELGEKDSLIVYFSGHGQVIDLPSHGTAGYLIPYDAALELEGFNDPEAWAKAALDMHELTREFEGTEIRHVLFVVDACCSGFMTRRGNFAARADLQELMARRSRSVLAASTDRTAALPDDRSGHGFFTGALLGALRSKDAASVTEVFLNARTMTVAKSNRRMLPQRGEFGTEDGEFVFLPKAIPPGQVEAAVRKVQQAEVERTARRTLPEHLYDILDAPNYETSPKRVDVEKLWQQRLNRFVENASLGDPLAMAGASLCLGRRFGVDGSLGKEKESYEYARKALSAGRPAGKYAVAVCLLNGTGVKQSTLAARQLLEEAFAEKFALAALPLADLLTAGEPAPEALRQAAALLEQAERDGIPGAVIRSAKLALKKNRQLSADEVAKWVERLQPAVKSNVTEAQYLTYDMLTLDPQRLTDKQRDVAYERLVQAAEAGYAEAQFRLAAEHYQKEWFTGRLGRKQDFAAAREWAEAASAQNHYEATKMLAVIHALGDGVRKDYNEAGKYYKRTRANGHLELDWLNWFLAHAPSASELEKEKEKDR